MNETIERLERYVAYPTISSNPIIDFASDLAQGAEDLGFRVQMIQSSPTKVNVLATAGPQEDSLVLSGHMNGMIAPTLFQITYLFNESRSKFDCRTTEMGLRTVCSCATDPDR